ncbi:MAG: DUF5820 family protein [Halobacteriaceae archaeon]
MDDADLPPGWTVWNAEPEGRVIFAYRPDVFDGDDYPAPCLPTLTVSRSNPDRRRPGSGRDGRWHVALFLEPDVRVREADGAHETRAAAMDAAVDAAAAFARGAFDVRAAYQVPRADYLDELTALVGASDADAAGR